MAKKIRLWEIQSVSSAYWQSCKKMVVNAPNILEALKKGRKENQLHTITKIELLAEED